MNSASRILVPLLVVLALAVAPARGADPEGSEGEGTGPTNVQQLERMLDALAKRLDALLKLADRDPRFRWVEIYTGYNVADFANARRPVKAEQLVSLMADPEAPPKLRDEAYKALISKDAKRHDPDLKETRGTRKPRRRFSRDHVVKLLTHKNFRTRELADKLLVDHFPELAEDPAVKTYTPKSDTDGNWGKAKQYWKRVLRR